MSMEENLVRWVPLNREAHASLRLTWPWNARFGADAHLARFTAAEFAEVALPYPSVFAESDHEPAPCALLGLERGRNQYVMPDGS